MKKLLVTACWLIIANVILAQQDLKLTILSDGDRGTYEFKELVKTEINALLGQQFNILYQEFNPTGSLESDTETIQRILEDDSDMLIALGFKSAGALYQIDNYLKPCLAGISLVPKEKETSGIPNYTYIQNPFSVSRDLEVLQSIRPFKNLGIFVPQNQPYIQTYINSFADTINIQFVTLDDDPITDLNALNPEIEAIYILPNLYDDPNDHQALIDGINARKLPSLSLIGQNDVERGVLASISSSDYIGVYARRMAINVMKVTEGQDPKDFPTQVSGIEDELVINVATMLQIEIYPPYEVLNKATFTDLSPKVGRQYSLQSAVAEALINNISYQSAQKNVSAQKAEIGIATSNLLPNVEIGSTVATIDKITAELLRAGQQITPQTQWSGNLSITQLIYSQPAIANIAIQKALLHSEEAGLMAQQLDLVLRVCETYLGVLQAIANLNIQNVNVQTTLRNLNIAKTKEQIGVISIADVYGFESQLALNKRSLNDARTLLEQSIIQFNQLLNRPLDEGVVLDDVLDIPDLLFIQDERISQRIQNNYDLLQFADFLTAYAIENAPELDQLAWTIQAQKKSLDINQKSRYLPQVALQSNFDKTLGRYGIRVADELFENNGVDPYQLAWNLGFNASIPLFQGNLRTKRIQKDKVLLDQLQLNQLALEQQFDANIRLSLANLGNSYNDILLTDQAQKSSNQYLELVQDLYREGVASIATLFDAQNNLVAAQLGAIASQYQFFVDAFKILQTFNSFHAPKA